MRFVIGGADSGKRDFVRENYGIDEILMADYDSVLTAKAVYGFHIFIKKHSIVQIKKVLLKSPCLSNIMTGHSGIVQKR